MINTTPYLCRLYLMGYNCCLKAYDLESCRERRDAALTLAVRFGAGASDGTEKLAKSLAAASVGMARSAGPSGAQTAWLDAEVIAKIIAMEYLFLERSGVALETPLAPCGVKGKAYIERARGKRGRKDTPERPQ